MTDDTGFTAHLPGPVSRVIALYGAFNEILLALDAGHVLAARTSADQSAALAHLPVIGTHMRPNAELVAAARPDVVLQMAGREEARLQAGNLRTLGMTVLTFEMNSFAQLFAVTETLGRLAGREERAAELVRGWRERLARLDALYGDRPRVRVFFEARYPNLLGAGRGGIASEIIARAGGENVLTEAQKLVRCSEEALLAADPDVYVVQIGPMNPAPPPPASRAHYKGLRAVRTGRVLMVPEDMYSRPGPRALDAAEELGRWLHPQEAEYAPAARLAERILPGAGGIFWGHGLRKQENMFSGGRIRPQGSSE